MRQKCQMRNFMKGVTYRRLIALSNCHGMFVAPSTSTPVSSFPTPFICTKNSVLIRLDASDSPSPRAPQRESTSSMKIIAGFDSRAIWKSCLTNLEGGRGAAVSN